MTSRGVKDLELFLLIRISLSGSGIRGSVLPGELTRTFLAPMGLMPTRDTHRILDPFLQEQVERPFSSQ
jgi:hypothetical protein